MFDHFDPYKHGLSHGLENQSSADDVIRIGYRTTEEQVHELLSAGVALAKARGEVYQYVDIDTGGIDDDNLPCEPYESDPVESFSLLDYQRQLKKEAEAKAEARRARAATAADGSDAKQSDQGAEPSEPAATGAGAPQLT